MPGYEQERCRVKTCCNRTRSPQCCGGIRRAGAPSGQHKRLLARARQHPTGIGHRFGERVFRHTGNAGGIRQGLAKVRMATADILRKGMFKEHMSKSSISKIHMSKVHMALWSEGALLSSVFSLGAACCGHTGRRRAGLRRGLAPAGNRLRRQLRTIDASQHRLALRTRAGNAELLFAVHTQWRPCLAGVSRLDRGIADRLALDGSSTRIRFAFRQEGHGADTVASDRFRRAIEVRILWPLATLPRTAACRTGDCRIPRQFPRRAIQAARAQKSGGRSPHLIWCNQVAC